MEGLALDGIYMLPAAYQYNTIFAFLLPSSSKYECCMDVYLSVWAWVHAFSAGDGHRYLLGLTKGQRSHGMGFFRWQRERVIYARNLCIGLQRGIVGRVPWPSSLL